MNRNLFAPTGFGPEDIDVQVSELLVATADQSDEQLDRSIGEVLRLLRERMGMDVVFVSEFVDGRRVFRKVAQAPGVQAIEEGAGAPLEESWCQHVVQGRLPEYIPDARQHPFAAPLLKNLSFPIGTHLSTPLMLSSGEVYGTLCCFSFGVQEKVGLEDLTRLKLTARLAAQRLDAQRQAGRQGRSVPPTVPDWQLKPK